MDDLIVTPLSAKKKAAVGVANKDLLQDFQNSFIESGEEHAKALTREINEVDTTN